jgi:hypothetical protein
MHKIIGIMTAWACEKWINPAIQQALEYCDEVIVSIGWHSEAMRKFKDSTLERAVKYPVTFTDVNFKGSHSETKAATMNNMIAKSKLFEEGNWIWLLDVDEFYIKEEIDYVKAVMFSEPYNAVEMNELFFIINMKHYLKNKRMRLWKIINKKDRFYPTNKWTGKRNKVFKFQGLGMFHYSMLLNPYAKREFWKTEYGYNQKHKVEWLDSYLKDNFNLMSMFKNMGSHFGKPFIYPGKHPRVIEETGLTKIKDFRKVYKA